MNVTMNSTLADALFGSSTTTSSNSFLSASSLGDWSLMKSGVYTRMLKSYYEKTGETSTDSTKSTTSSNKLNSLTSDKIDSLKTTTTDNTLSSIKSAASSFSTAAKAVTSDDYEKSTRDELYENVNALVSNYNSMITAAGKSELTSITQSTKWMENDTKSRKDQLSDVGITIGTDNKLTIDKDKFSAASLSDIESLFEGSSSFAGKLSQRASGLYNLASNQIAFNSGSTLYSSSASLI